MTRVVAVGDSALRLDFDERIALEVHVRVVAAASRLAAAALAGVRDVVPAYCSVTVYFDPLRVDRNRLRRALEEAGRVAPGDARPPRTVRVPVCYGGALGPDLEEVAAFGGLPAHEVVARHVGRPYRVFMIGFVPGFAYMGMVDERIAAPRRATPRTRVPAGSVGIAGIQTGVYPRETPGGWQIIGRTPSRVFEPARVDPNVFAVGDEVRFEAINRAVFDQLATEAG